MAVHKGPVLVDTNLMIEAHATGCWKALAGHYHLVTVVKCSEEVQTGRMRIDRRIAIADKDLRTTLAAIEPVADAELLTIDLLGGEALHAGEKHLWAHALGRTDDWVLCGPDIASLRFGFEQGERARLVSLEELLKPINVQARPAVRRHFTVKWHQATMTQFTQQALKCDAS